MLPASTLMPAALLAIWRTIAASLSGQPLELRGTSVQARA